MKHVASLAPRVSPGAMIPAPCRRHLSRDPCVGRPDEGPRPEISQRTLPQAFTTGS